MAAFDAGVWRRDSGASATSFNQVFAPQFNQGAGIDRAMFALTVKNMHTRIYLTEGTQNGGGIAGPLASNFWRLDNANQSAAALLATQAAGATPPVAATHTFPAVYNGWQNLTSKTTGDPYFATDDFCTGQCWYDEDVYTPHGMPDTVYVIGSNQYGEQPCDTNGVGCGNGRSNGREVLYSNTAGDPDGSATGAGSMRTFTDLSYDAHDQPSVVVRLRALLRPGLRQRTQRDPSRPARGHHQPRQSDPDLRELGRRDHPNDWKLRRHLGAVRQSVP